VWSCTLFGLLPVSFLQARENIILAELHVAEGDPTSVKFPLTHTTNQKNYFRMQHLENPIQEKTLNAKSFLCRGSLLEVPDDVTTKPFVGVRICHHKSD